MNYPRYLRGFAKITILLTLVMFCIMVRAHNDIVPGLYMLFVVPMLAIFTWFAIAVLFEIGKWIWKDFRKEEI
jgi:hypothetical protein